MKRLLNKYRYLYLFFYGIIFKKINMEDVIVGLFKNLFYYSVGKGLSKNHSDAAGFGLMSLGMLSDQLSTQEKDKKAVLKEKENIINSFRKITFDNKQYFGNDYLKEIYKYENKLVEMSFDNWHETTTVFQKFLNEMIFHIYAASSSLDIIEKIEKFPKEKLKPKFLPECKAKVESIRNSIVPLETLNLWEDFMHYLNINNVEIENYEEVKEKLEQMIR